MFLTLAIRAHPRAFIRTQQISSHLHKAQKQSLVYLSICCLNVFDKRHRIYQKYHIILQPISWKVSYARREYGLLQEEVSTIWNQMNFWNTVKRVCLILFRRWLFLRSSLFLRLLWLKSISGLFLIFRRKLVRTLYLDQISSCLHCFQRSKEGCIHPLFADGNDACMCFLIAILALILIAVFGSYYRRCFNRRYFKLKNPFDLLHL